MIAAAGGGEDLVVVVVVDEKAGEIGFQVLMGEEAGGYSRAAAGECFPGRIGWGYWRAGLAAAD